MGIHIFWNMKRDEYELVTSEQLIQLLGSIVGICGRAMSKHGDKKTQPAINVTSEVSLTLEKSLVLLHDHILQALAKVKTRPQKEQQIFRREMSAEIVRNN